MKEYQKPELEFVTLVAQETITDEIIDGDLGLESSEF